MAKIQVKKIGQRCIRAELALFKNRTCLDTQLIRVKLCLLRHEYDFKYSISVFDMHDVFYPFSKQPPGQVRVYVVAHYPMQKSGGLRQKKSRSISWTCEGKSFGLHKATVDTTQCFYSVINVERWQITDWSSRYNAVWLNFWVCEVAYKPF